MHIPNTWIGRMTLRLYREVLEKQAKDQMLTIFTILLLLSVCNIRDIGVYRVKGSWVKCSAFV